MTFQQKIQQYIDEKKDIYICLLNFLEKSSDDDENDFQIFVEKISKDKYEGDRDEISQILYSINR